MFKLIHQDIDTGAGLMTLVILRLIEHVPKFSRPQFCLPCIACVLKQTINAGIILLISIIPIAVNLAYLIFKFCDVIGSGDRGIKIYGLSCSIFDFGSCPIPFNP